MRDFILGGVRSGKSRLAEARARASGHKVLYIATARDAGDGELHARIAAHRARRPANWLLIEEPVKLADTLTAHAAHGHCLLVECLTLWMTNLLCEESEQVLAQERETLVEILPALPGQIILVSNETGLGIVPITALSRRFSDEIGALHQRLAALCERVTFMVAGLPMTLKGSDR